MTENTPTTPPQTETVPAGHLPPWQVGEMPAPPDAGWRLWVGLLGPGVVLAGTSIGSGEWLFGPAVSAQYGATLMWLATISIVFQVFCNLMMMRYAIYCGEPIVVGILRTKPGPKLWVTFFVCIDIAAIWPYNASNAAVPLAAAILGHLPRTADEIQFVQYLGVTVFLLSFVPLIFGGKVYSMLEWIMTLKLVVVLSYLTFIAVFMVSGAVIWDVATGFFRFGNIPLRADTTVVDRHFTIAERDGDTTYVLKGIMEKGRPVIAEFRVERADELQKYKMVDWESLDQKELSQSEKLELRRRRQTLIDRAVRLARPNAFFVETESAGEKLIVAGAIREDRSWQIERMSVADANGAQSYRELNQVPDPYRKRFEQLTENRGLEVTTLFGYVKEYGKLPPVDWAILAAFIAIAGAGGMSNTLFSNYARDKGWGMGKHVGAIPSAIGGRMIKLSHVGMVAFKNVANRSRWLGWIRHIVRDQVAVWMVCSFLGMALPCMMSVEFIRNHTIEGSRVAAMVASGMEERYTEFGPLLWTLTLLCGFLVLAPGQVSVNDQISRRWTDIIWTASERAKRLKGNQVKYIYYSIMSLYLVWGLVMLTLFDPLDLAKFGAVIGTIALGSTSLLALYANRTLLPKEVRPGWFLQLGVVCCGIFFLSLSIVVFSTFRG